MATIKRAVGKGVTNLDRNEVSLVQKMLNSHRPVPLRKIGEEGLVGPETISAIEEFQRRVLKMTMPDGRVDPGGATLRALSGQSSGSAHAAAGAPASAGSLQSLAEGLKANGVKNETAQANAAAVLQALKDNGITSARAQANVLAQVNAECGFLPRSEGNYSADALYRLYGSEQKKNKVRFETLDDAKAVVDQGSVAVFDKIYGDRMGNNDAGEGFKYRGRGYIQLTGKDNYKRVGNAIGVDLVGHPDLANDPQVATKILLNFLGVKAGNQSNLEGIDKVNKKVGPAGPPTARGIFADAILPYLQEPPKKSVPLI